MASDVLVCFINPSDILSFQSEGQALRTDAIFPNNVFDETVSLKGIYHSSEFDKMSTARVDALIAKAVEDGVDILEYQNELPSFNEGEDAAEDGEKGFDFDGLLTF